MAWNAVKGNNLRRVETLARHQCVRVDNKILTTRSKCKIIETITPFAKFLRVLFSIGTMSFLKISQNFQTSGSSYPIAICKAFRNEC
ncbi:uncharacterized protein PHALS_14907 [Plasmopara halstedii]|uniref:Uncharacterized protein n=1 Tax=Plasmopara halstedii TaxID=4781 RepID=A0A0P1A7W2_PLAHL|nr:uncharacterized protein PHALS_14907 [Plasmopara halstedii]CEG36574.1 hypothetical protein PHALS_14907 [Plasmopara halstedii]|eukprot:XP_024572943.1 hypothetical protein PHALS_14907 [Plasmopara halstedii]